MVLKIISIIAIVLWIYILSVLYRAKVSAAYYIIGSVGFFLISMIYFLPIFVTPLSRLTATLTGIFGSFTHTFTAYYKYAMLFIQTDSGTVNMTVDFECSGFIEIVIFLSLLMFSHIYKLLERFIIAFIGTFYIIMANVIRIITVCVLVNKIGFEFYSVAHSVIGKIIFYAFTIILYYYVLTRKQIKSIKIGNFGYEKKNE